MDIYELKIKIYLLKDIKVNETQNYLAYFIDSVLVKNKQYAQMHEQNTYKYYTFDSLYPLAKNGIYKADNIYVFRIRTIDYKLAEYFSNNLSNNRTNELQGLTTNIKILKQHLIKKIYTLTPVIIKTENGYWKNNLSLNDFEERLKTNLIKKYNNLFNCKLDEDFQFYNYLKFKNKVPVSRKYKNITLLGDMLELEIAENDIAQKLAWLAIGVSLGELSARGYGMVNYQFY
ncbi:CRISPR-associated endoribonuclease Cas6 [Erysipelatoclostridium sp. An173]|uniref:CRISPR-associated endoribonuclease Cas6 n=1 Tax=Erysipelatoclostridium sp. An173 TaxID=1965571 RepID=UPI000B36C6D0|nr:CRISPR-associated endoribonuclease Cas6 [Erysipelatoclostridium sp. An173]OUP77387.1 CRISPR-associated endoribonuclease Cas6 [Erysipelatoclostridium sp. An173]